MRYGREYKERVLGEFHASGLGVRAACARVPGFPHWQTLYAWLREERAGLLEAAPVEVPGLVGHRRWARYPAATRAEALRLLRLGWRPCEAARRLGVSSGGLVSGWARAALRGSISPGKPGKPGKPGRPAGRREGAVEAQPERTEWRDAWGDLPEDPAERAAVAERRLYEALAVLDALKAPGPASLTGEEKYLAGQRARADGAPLAGVLSDFSIARSTYHSQGARLSRPDRRGPLRGRIRLSFERSGGRFGYRSVWADLRRGEGEPVGWRDLAEGDLSSPVVVSEKVVREEMAAMGLVAAAQRAKARRRWSSYAGEPSARPGNLPLREDGSHDFSSAGPGELLVTDVTEFSLNGFKCYLSPVIDCFDGDPLAWSVSRSPDAGMACASLEAALAKCGPGAVVHTDGGAPYRSARWEEACRAAGAVRSMSRKGRSPDNARAEGFFGTLKVEFFHGRDWAGVTYERFVGELGEYIGWYRDEKPRRSLGWKTIREHRASLGYVV